MKSKGSFCFFFERIPQSLQGAEMQRGNVCTSLPNARILTTHLPRCTPPRRCDEYGERRCDGSVRRRRARLAAPAPAGVSSGGPPRARTRQRASRWHVARLRTTAVLSRVHVVRRRPMILPQSTPARPPPPPDVRRTLTDPHLLRLCRALQLFLRRRRPSPPPQQPLHLSSSSQSKSPASLPQPLYCCSPVPPYFTKRCSLVSPDLPQGQHVGPVNHLRR